MQILVVDNYDSFTFNLVHYVEKLTDAQVDVMRNDEIELEQVAGYSHVLLSPGPGLPADAGMLVPLIKAYAASKKILGVCLGHQAIAEVFGGKLVNLDKVYHGVSGTVSITDFSEQLFTAIPDGFQAGRYHSWTVDPATLPSSLKVTAVDDERNIMALRHNHFDLRGVQFHPESIMTEYGEQLIHNWLKS